MSIVPLTVLCIDDDDDDTALFNEAMQLIDDSCICITISGAIEGLHLLQGAIPDIIFLDINMPIMDGREALTNIRKVAALAEVPVYMLSTTIDRHELESLRMIGATDCFSKPQSFQGLYELLNELVVKFKARNGSL